MAHEIARLLLEHAGSFFERTEAITTSLTLGMPLGEINAYLDWLDAFGRPERALAKPPTGSVPCHGGNCSPATKRRDSRAEFGGGCQSAQ